MGFRKGKAAMHNEDSALELRRLFVQLQAVIKPDIFIEAGAHNAELSMEIRRICPNMRIVAFEANPIVYQRSRLKFDHDGSRIEYLNLAVSSEPGVVSLNIPKSINDKAIHSMTKRSSLRVLTQPATYDTVQVRAVSLDTFFPPPVLPCSLWIDVEGATREVLTGGSRVLGAAECLLVEVETVPVWHGQWLASDVKEFLAKLGLGPVARDFERKRQHNVIFLRNAEIYRSTIEAGLQSSLIGIP
jgi:FkbM family methyltransferase